MSHWPKNLVQGHFTPFTNRHNERNEQERTKGKESVVLTRIFLGVLIYDPFSHCSPFIQRFSAGEVWNRLGEREKIYMVLTRILNIGLLWHQPLTQKLVQCHCTPFTLSGWSMSKIGLIGHKIFSRFVMWDRWTIMQCSQSSALIIMGDPLIISYD